MKILHGTWIPQAEGDFVQQGEFFLWVETTGLGKKSKKPHNVHPSQLFAKDLETFLAQSLGIKSELRYYPISSQIVPRYFLLPSHGDRPLPSLELARYLEQEIPESFDLQYWQVDCYTVKTPIKASGFDYQLVSNIIKLLNELHFIAINNLAEVQLGADLLFWYHYTQAFKQIILADQYIPALKYRELKTAKSKSTKSTSTAKGERKSTKTSPKAKLSQFELYPGWEIVSDRHEENIQRFVEHMPLACVAGFAEPQEKPEFYDRETLLRHFSECLLTEIVTHTPSTAGFDKKINDTLIHNCVSANQPLTNVGLELYQEWKTWRDRIHHTQTAIPFYLCFQLCEPSKPEDGWELQFLVSPRQDPSLRVSLLDYWRMRPAQQKELHKQTGENFQQNLLLNLGYAARIYPQLWQGLDTRSARRHFYGFGWGL